MPSGQMRLVGQQNVGDLNRSRKGGSISNAGRQVSAAYLFRQPFTAPADPACET